MPRHDHAFIPFAVLKDFEKYKPTIRAKISSGYPATPLSALVVVMNYVLVPMEIEIVLASSYRDECETKEEQLELDDFGRMAREQEGCVVVTSVHMRDGEDYPIDSSKRWITCRKELFRHFLSDTP